MKCLFLIFSLTILNLTAIRAQESMQFGLKAGVNFSNMNSDIFLNSSTRTGFHFGLFTEIPLESKWSFQPEVLYASQGAEAEVSMEGNPRVKYQLDYIQVPIIIKWYLIKSLSLDAGPSFNFLLKDTIDGEETEIGSNFEFGGALGTTYKFREDLFGSARYVYGLTNAFDKEFSNTFTTNFAIQLGVGYIF